MVHYGYQQLCEHETGDRYAKSAEAQDKSGGEVEFLQHKGCERLECNPSRDKDGKKPIPVQEAVQGPQAQPRGDVESDGGDREDHNPIMRADSLQNGPSWPSEDLTTSKSGSEPVPAQQ
jgi:hypothetical protein